MYLICYSQSITGWRIGQVFSFTEQFAGLVNASASGDSGVENIINLKAWDSDGKEIPAEYDPDTGTATFGGIPAKMTYDYVTGFEDVNMDVTVFAAESGGINGVESNGGCNAEFALLVLLAGLLLTMVRKKRQIS